MKSMLLTVLTLLLCLLLTPLPPLPPLLLRSLSLSLSLLWAFSSQHF
jgi:hypothetical protein